ncbi:MAG: hypothetical protein J6U04_11515 [Salinivirgaceae bacterium]|nr:hypothetical protein [Salinivirgaceae bacterium]
MKRLFFSMALFAATMIGFNSCDNDDDKNVDVREQAVGDYTVSATLYLYDGKTLTELEGGDDEVPPMGKAEVDGDGMKLTADGEVINLVKIAEASNGFTFDVKDMSITETDEETGEPYTYTLNGFNGYELKSADGNTVKYHGGFISSTKTLEFYVQMPEDQALALIALLALPEDLMGEFMAKLITGDEDGAYAILREFAEGRSVVMKVTCVKK